MSAPGPANPSGAGGTAGGVQSLVGSVRARLLRRGTVAAFLWWASLSGVVLVGAWFLAGSDGWSPRSPVPLVLLFLVVLSAGGAVAFLLRARSRALGEEAVMRRIEEVRGLPPGVLKGALELSRGRGADLSPALAREAERQVLARVGAPGEVSAGRLERRVVRAVRWGGGAFGLTVALLAILLFLQPDRAVRAWVGVGSSVNLLAAPSLPSLELEPGDAEVSRGDDLQVRIVAGSRERVYLHRHGVGEVLRTDTILVEEGEGSARIGQVRAPLEYWATAPDGDETGRYEVTPTDPVFISGLRLEVTPPAYTGLPPEQHEGDLPPLSVPEGSEVHLEARTSEDLDRARLSTPEGEELELETSGEALSLRWTPRESGAFEWSLVDARGQAVEAGAPPPLDLTVIPDSVPRVEFLYPARDTILPLSRRQPLMVEAEDDYGLERVEVVAVKGGDEDDPRTSGSNPEGARTATFRSVLDLTSWDLREGDVVRYYARAVDNHPSGQEARSREYVLRVPGRSEISSETSRELDGAAGRAEELAERARSVEEEARELSRRTREAQQEAQGARDGRRGIRQGDDEDGDGALDFETEEDLRRGLEAQEEVLDGVDSLREDLERLARDLADVGLDDPDLSRDLAELRDLLSEMASPEFRERLRDMAERLDDGDLDRVAERLDELMHDQSDLRERLEDSLERFRRAATEQEMRATGDEAEELAQEERRLEEGFRDGEDPAAGVQDQRALEERTDAFRERLEALGDRLEEMGEEKSAEAARESARDAQEAVEAMEGAAGSAELGEGTDAAEQAGEAAEALEGVMEELRSAQEEMAEEFREVLQGALASLAHDALSLARQQGELQDRLPRRGGRRNDALAAEETAIRRGLENVAANLAFATRMAPEISRRMGPALGEAMEAVDQTLDALSSDRGPSPGRAGFLAHEALNRLAHEALRQAENMGSEGPSGAAESIQEQLEALAERQDQVRQETEGVMPMEEDLGMEAMMEALQELSVGQGEIAGGLDDLADQPGGEQDAMGDLEDMAEEARSIEEEMRQGRADDEMLERQERLFQRLLDAGRTLERDEEGGEREGTTAQDVEAAEVDPLAPDVLEGLRFAPPSAAELEGLSPAQRRLIMEYFERLNRSGGEPQESGGGGR